ncbi:hypothetical protein OG216_45060 [Streptomycetaceae bacterium NBC_01309]
MDFGMQASQQAQQQFQADLSRQRASNYADQARRSRLRRGGSSFLGKLLKLAILAGIIVFVAQNPDQVQAWFEQARDFVESHVNSGGGTDTTGSGSSS